MLNGQMAQRVRERIPTPENDNRLNGHHNINHNPFGNIQSIATGVAMSAQNLATTPSIFPTSTNGPPTILGTLLLSPIKESDSVNNTISSGSLANNNSILQLNLSSTNTQSLVIPTSSNQDMDSSTKSSYVVISNESENLSIPVSITTVPITITQNIPSTQTSAVITELPFDQPDSSVGLRSRTGTLSLENLFSDSPVMTPSLKHKVQRQQSVESNRSGTGDNNSNASHSSNSTQSKRPGAGNNHSEVYV